MQHRSEIDGLRALAILPVVVYHANASLLPAGFIGVDIFFVISGYLITQLLVGELRDTGRLNIWGFYERRVRRILPALVVTMALAAGVSVVVLFPHELVDVGSQLTFTSLFAANYLSLGRDYFDAANTLQPLMHTWSLSVEEQFYVVFPLALVLLSRLSGRLVWWLAGIALLSFGIAIITSGVAPLDNFYSSLSRAFELLAGAMSATLGRLPLGRFRQGLSALGVGLIAVSYVLFDGHTPWPSLPTILPVAGTCLVLLYATEETLIARLLSFAGLRWCGLLSYSAYLIHQPLFAFTRVLAGGDVLSSSSYAPLLVVGLIVATFALAALSWRYVEQPWRRGRSRRGRQRAVLLVGAAATLLAFAGLGLVFSFSGGLPQRLTPQVQAILAVADDRSAECPSTSKPPKTVQTCAFGNTENITVALMGDSHAAALAPQLGDALAGRGVGLTVFSRSGCPALVGLDRVDEKGTVRDCPKGLDAGFSILEQHPEIKTVILLARWTQWAELSGFNNLEGGVERPNEFIPTVNGTAYRVPDTAYRNALSSAFVATIDRLHRMGRRVVLIQAVPETAWNVPERVARRFAAGAGAVFPLATSFDVFKSRADTGRQILLGASQRGGDVLVLDPSVLFCNSIVPNRCLNELDGAPLYRDEGHISAKGGRMIADMVVATLAGKGWM
ncbi:acyltransferase family protein [Devosia sp.]|uniref:acyltransferase family protein n=1 Tax=Devosia sp. TaxID=1871048 RepID=UPI003BAD4928